MTSWTSDQPVARPLPAHRETKTQNKRTQTSMPQVGFEPSIRAFEREKTVRASDCADAAIGEVYILLDLISLGFFVYCILFPLLLALEPWPLSPLGPILRLPSAISSSSESSYLIAGLPACRASALHFLVILVYVHCDRDIPARLVGVIYIKSFFASSVVI
jgi:hypothetical protein